MCFPVRACVQARIGRAERIEDRSPPPRSQESRGFIRTGAAHPLKIKYFHIKENNNNNKKQFENPKESSEEFIDLHTDDKLVGTVEGLHASPGMVECVPAFRVG